MLTIEGPSPVRMERSTGEEPMSKLSLRRAIAACTLPAAVLAAPSVVFAEEAIEEVVVTGSFIRGTPQDAALP
ncbi:MAG: hypothetical protein EBY45_12400, partial [Gammaproteobacteria bacterium]|nr:hypothetical protein [Gammaproteobacteria bacterium]